MIVKCPTCKNEVATNASGRLTRDIEAALTTVRKEAREAAWKKAIKVVEAVHRNTMGSVSDWQVLRPLESAMKKDLEAAANTEEGGGDG